MSTTGRGWKEQSNVAPLSVMACGEARARPPVSLRRGRSAARRGGGSNPDRARGRVKPGSGNRAGKIRNGGCAAPKKEGTSGTAN